MAAPIPSRVSIWRPLIITALAFVLALALERFGSPSFPAIPAAIYAGDVPFRVVYSELRDSESNLWIADPSEPMGKRRKLITIDHQTGYGVVGSISPDGAMLAYAFLPSGRRDAFADGQLWVATIDGRHPRLVSSNIDLHVTPIWRPDGRAILFKVVETSTGQIPTTRPVNPPQKPDQMPPDQGVSIKTSLMVSSLDDPSAQKLAISAAGLGLYPIGWSADGESIFYYTMNSGGAEASEVAVETAASVSLGKLDDGPIWDLQLSPDRHKLLFVKAETGGATPRGAVWQYDIDNRQASAVSSIQDGPVGATWHPSGSSITRNGSPASGAARQAILSTSVAGGDSSSLSQESEDMTSIPVSWSPDALFLAVRRRSLAPDGRIDNLALFDSRTGRTSEIGGGYADIVGWTDKTR